MGHEGGDRFDERFRPLRPVSRARLIAAFVLGPLAWVVALAILAWLIERTSAIQIGLLVTLVSLVVSAIVLSVLRVRRLREEHRYEHRA